MGVGDLLAKVRAKAAQRSGDREAAWLAAVGRAAAGKDVDPDDVLRLLEATGRDAEAFARDVARHARRADLHAKARAVDGIGARRAAASAKLDALKAEFQAAEERYRAACRPLLAEVRQCGDREVEGQSARQELMDGCPYPQVVARVSAARGAVLDAEAALRDIEERRGRVADATRLPEEKIGIDYSAAIAEARKRLPQIDAELAAAREALDRLRAARDAAEEELLTP